MSKKAQATEEDYEEQDMVGSANINNLLSERLTAISDNDLSIVRYKFEQSETEVICEGFNVQITGKDFRKLKPRMWLNDEIVNFYMQLLQQRDNELCQQNENRKACKYFSSHFMTKLLDIGNDKGYMYANVRRWTRKFDVFAMDKVFFPINISNTHWTIAVWFVQCNEIHYYDSMHGNGKTYLTSIRKWIVDDAKDKKKETLNEEDYQMMDHQSMHVPTQQNGFDCGVFSIMAADFLSDNLPFTYTQNDMEKLRNKIASSILNVNITY